MHTDAAATGTVGSPAAGQRWREWRPPLFESSGKLAWGGCLAPRRLPGGVSSAAETGRPTTNGGRQVGRARLACIPFLAQHSMPAHLDVAHFNPTSLPNWAASVFSCNIAECVRTSQARLALLPPQLNSSLCVAALFGPLNGTRVHHLAVHPVLGAASPATGSST